MSVVTIEEAQQKLAELVDKLNPGEEILLTKDQVPVARIVANLPAVAKVRRPGTMRGTVLYVAPDFDAPLEDFKEYMP
jgi:antitoxin (DNA-binding transcriptional repressor) of toxin-antitoxin stability system